MDIILKLDNLDVDVVKLIPNSTRGPKRSRTELSAIEYAFDLKLFDIVNQLILAGANCRNLDFKLIDGKLNTAETILLLYTLGYQVDKNRWRLDDEPNVYKQQFQSLWKWFQIESKSMVNAFHPCPGSRL